jgi:Tol biopolymer transport system component
LFEHPSISWSLDGKFIFFTDWSAKDTGFVIFNVSIETQTIAQVVALPHGVWGDQSPSVSPDGKYAAFVRRKEPSMGDIYVKNLADNTIQPITNLQTKQKSHVKELPHATTGSFTSIEIAPDESYILYSKSEPTKSDIVLVENVR